MIKCLARSERTSVDVNVTSLEALFAEELARLQGRMADTEQQRRVRAAELRMLEEENRTLRESHERGLAELLTIEREIQESEASLGQEMVGFKQMPLLEAPPEVKL